MATKLHLTKEYLRYRLAGNFSIIASPNCNSVLLTLEKQEGRFVGVAAAEDIIVWDLRLGEKALVLKGDKYQVTRLAASPDKATLAAGFTDGTIKISDLKTAEVVASFSGHLSPITCLVYDEVGHTLASGSADTHIVLWDVVGETGLVRFSEHQGPVTGLVFLPGSNILVSGSKDSRIKFWDLDTSYCFKTLSAHRTEVWSLALLQGCYLVVGSSDDKLRVWTLSERIAPVGTDATPSATPNPDAVDDTDNKALGPIRCVRAGTILRMGRGRVMALTQDPQGQVLACLGTGNLVELFAFADETAAHSRRKKRLAKDRKKAALKPKVEVLEGEEKEEEEEEEEEMPLEEGEDEKPPGEDQLILRDIVRRLAPIRASDGKAKGVDLVLGASSEMRVAVNLSSNTVELHSLNVAATAKAAAPQLLRRISSHGHHSELRAVAFSSDNMAVLSASGESVKLWNRPSMTCLRTIALAEVVSLVFAPGDRHALAGTKSGRLVILDLQSADVLEEIPAHGTELWALTLTPDQRGCVSGGGDKTVKFWQFELVAEKPSPEDEGEDGEDEAIRKESPIKVLSLLHIRTLTLDETVLAVKMSSNGTFLAVALLDSTVKIFFADTFKFFVALYGHKLPVLCLDISQDCKLIATGSSDRTIKVWGMDFGDCRKSLFAHDDSVTALAFVPNSKMIFSCSKDGKVKLWDCVNYQRVQTLQGHFGGARSLAVSPDARWVVSCGADAVVRLVERSDEILELSDERETEREELAAEEQIRSEKTMVLGKGNLSLPSCKTAGSENAAEQLMECLEICAQMSQDPSMPIHPLMQAYNVKTGTDFLLLMLRKIRASDLQEALLLLQFASVTQLLRLLPGLLTTAFLGDGELIVKVAVFLVAMHRGPIVASSALLPTIIVLQRLAMQQVVRLRDLVGRNLYGLHYLQDRVEERDQVELFKDAELNRQTKKRRPKRRAVIAL